MKPLVPAMGVLLSLGAPAAAVTAAAPRADATPAVPDFAHFQIILDRMPFGTPPPPPPPVAQPESPAKALAEKNLARQIRLCAVTRTQQGVAAGLVDSSSNPPKNFYLYVGESMDGVTLVAADLENETAEIEKEGVRLTFTMTGVKSGPSPAAPALAAAPSRSTSIVPAPPAPTAVKPPADAPPRSGIVRRPSQAGLPPMPGFSALQIAEMQQTREELAKLRETGGDVKSYMERLRERKAEENAAKAAAEKAARDAVQDLARKLTEEELAKREREINLALIEQGARPISDIVLTPEEEKALVEKGILP